ncbi:Lrp/AsnC family transcriptional regulator [Candidatus Woesearchaeota archaeon]|nr:Lrp/AsnC family transcriptional regulator [Candidatus Woesearchaeota archaeon]
MDKKDEQIIECLSEDSSLTTREISKKTRIPITTVHKRIKKLKQEGTIKKFTIELDNKKIGKAFSAIILISCDYKLLKELKKDQHQLAKELSHIPEVVSVDVVTGVTDIVVKVRMKDVEEFDTFLLKKFQKILGVDRTQSLVVMHEA